MAKRYFRHRLGVAATATDPFLHKSNRVPSGERWHVDRVAVENETSAATSVRIEVDRAGEAFVLAEKLAPNADTLYWDDDPVVLTEGELIQARWAGHTNGDALKLYIYGWAEDMHNG